MAATERSPKKSRRSIITAGSILGKYRIEKEIGRGGMGIVYQARDEKLCRSVALKFLSNELLRNRQAIDRFQKEARSASALNHPNICTIYEINEHKGRHFIAMEFLIGQTLDQRFLAKPPQMDEIIDIAIQITEGLAIAHSEGIIHRDIKPANIFITKWGHAKILDFGLAKLLQEKSTDVHLSKAETMGQLITLTGNAVGTISYMSPEQAMGDELDVRTDLFSLGIVLYEMAVGVHPFRKTAAADTINAILNKAPKAPAPANPEFSDELEHIISKALEKNRALRYQSASDMGADLKRLRTGGISSTSQNWINMSSPSAPSIAVLPFVNMGGDKEQEYFSDGLAEEIINALTKIPELKVSARTSSFHFRGKEAAVNEIAERLKVNNVLEGSVRKSGNRIRVTAQLINAADGYHLWSERYDREMTDVFTIQDEICEAIVDKLRVRLTGARPLIKRHTENIEAYSYYMKGRYLFYRVYDLENLDKCREYYEKSIAADPNYALAWYGLAKYYWWMGWVGFISSKTAKTEFSRAAVRALDLDEMLAEAHSMIGGLRALEYDWTAAEREFQIAMELNPQSVEVWCDYVFFYLLAMRRLDEAIAALKKGLELDPLSLILQNLIANFYYLKGRYNTAIKHWQNALEIDPQYSTAHVYIGLCYFKKGMIDEGIRICEMTGSFLAQQPMLKGFVGASYAHTGFVGEAQKILEELEMCAQEKHVPPSSFVPIYHALGEADKCLDWFGKAVDEHDAWIFFIHADDSLKSLHSDPRYKALLRKMHLKP